MKVKKNFLLELKLSLRFKCGHKRQNKMLTRYFFECLCFVRFQAKLYFCAVNKIQLKTQK